MQNAITGGKVKSMDFLNELVEVYEPLFILVNSIIGILISIFLCATSFVANKIAKSNYQLALEQKRTTDYKISRDDRELFRSVYMKLTDAIGLVLKDGAVNSEAVSLFWQARDQARLELPNHIYDYVEGIFAKMHKAYRLNRFNLNSPDDGWMPVGDERSKAAKEHDELISDIMSLKPHDVFSPYMKIKTPLS